MNIKSYFPGELEQEFQNIGLPKYRAKQVFEWLHRKLKCSYGEMTNISKDLRQKLEKEYPIIQLKAIRRQESQRDGTVKYLFELPDGNAVESVFMPYNYGNTVCVSSQVGCRMGCRFCASTLDGLVRNLEAGEILEQIYEITRLQGVRISNIVVMGTGEPMDNYDNVIRFVRLITSPSGLNISGRNITISTCGIVEGIKKLSKEKLPVTLALSLHRAKDEDRKELMPVANRYSIRELMEACKDYFEETGRRVSFEYGLIAGKNDSKAEAILLSGLAKEVGAHVNLIPINPIKERNYKRPDLSNTRAFKDILEKKGINVSIRKEMGADIDGACGQLRRRVILENKPCEEKDD